MIEPCIISPDVDTRVTIVEMLALLVEHNPQQVRDYLLRQAKDKQQVSGRGEGFEVFYFKEFQYFEVAEIFVFKKLIF